jgi:hypothetical protein
MSPKLNGQAPVEDKLAAAHARRVLDDRRLAPAERASGIRRIGIPNRFHVHTTYDVAATGRAPRFA